MPLTGDRKREYQREWMRKRREDYFTGKVCAECGSDEDLELDHIDPKVKVSHKIWSWSSGRRDAELEKCQTLCRVCHKERSKEQQRVYHPHGDHRKYYNERCRCRPCTDAAVARANWYRRRRQSLVV